MAITDKFKELENIIGDIGNAIRTKTGKTGKITLDEIPNEIKNMTIKPEASKKIIERTTPQLYENDFPGIIRVGEYAFAKYENLESIEIPNTVTSIGTGALEDCSSLESITVPFIGKDENGEEKAHFGHVFGAKSRYENGEYIPSSLKSVKITGGESIDDGAFYDCNYITKIDMKESLIKDIGILAFYGCNSLQKVELPDTIENVGIGSFYNCNNLAYKTVDGIKYLGNDENPYLYCEGARLNVLKSSATIQDGCKIIGAGAFLGCVLLGSVAIPSSVEYISDYAFRNCSRLSTVSFANDSKLKSIGKEAFRDCSGLLGGITSITIPNSVQTIGRSAFKGCDKLETLTIPFVGRTRNANERHSHFGYIFGADSYTQQKDRYDENGELIAESVVPDTLKNVYITDTKYIGEYAFYGCNLTKLEIPSNLEYVGQYAFNYANISTKNYGAGFYAYLGNSKDPHIYFLGSYDEISKVANIDIVADCKFIGTEAFKDCSNIEHIYFNSDIDLIDIGDNAFEGCISLEYNIIESENSVGYNYISKYLGPASNPYLYCVSATADRGGVEIHDDCKFIGSKAFADYSGDVTINGQLKAICSSAFANFNGNIVAGTSDAYRFLNRIGDYAFRYANFNAHNLYSVKHIGKGAFINNFGTTSVELADTETIGEGAFEDCYNLRYVLLKNTNITNIKDSTFANCGSFDIIQLNDNIERIGMSAFKNCEIGVNMDEGFVLPNSLISIDDNAFNNCRFACEVLFDGTVDQWVQIEFGNSKSTPISSDVNEHGLYIKYGNDYEIVENVVLDKAYKISDYAFFKYTKLKSIKISDTVTSIGASSLEECNNLRTISIGENALFDFSALALGDLSSYITLDEDVSKIKDYAFYNSGIENIDIPEGCKSIGVGAFTYCNNLTNIIVPQNVEILNKGIFKGCANLRSAELSCKATSIPAQSFYLCGKLESVVLPSGITSIGESAFEECHYLTSIVIPDGVTSIGDWAFYNCTSLTNIVIPDSVTSIGKNAFYGCPIEIVTAPAIAFDDLNSSTLKEIAITSGEVPSGAFQRCSNLTNVIIGDGVTNIGDYAFENCYHLTNITIGDNVTSIGDEAFGGCESLTSIMIPNSVTSIGRYAFSHCDFLTSIVIPDSVTSIGEDAFFNCPIEKAIIPSSASSYIKKSSLKEVVITSGREISSNAFDGCASLISVTIGEGITSIGYNAFSGCTSLTTIEIPNSVIYIFGYAFEYCSSLTNITIPNSVTYIGSHAFYDCSSLTSITIPDCVTSIGSDAFAYCSSLTNVSTPALAIPFIKHNSIKELTITSGNEIPSSAFEGNTSLTRVTISDVAKIGSRAFMHCKNLYWLTLNGVKEIGDSAFEMAWEDGVDFYDYTSLRRISLGDALETIGNYAFYGCTAFGTNGEMIELTLPATLKSIGKQAFKKWDYLFSIRCYATTPPVFTNGSSAFPSYNPSKYTLTFIKVPASNIQDYRLADGWNEYYKKEQYNNVTIFNAI